MHIATKSRKTIRPLVTQNEVDEAYALADAIAHLLLDDSEYVHFIDDELPFSKADIIEALGYDEYAQLMKGIV